MNAPTIVLDVVLVLALWLMVRATRREIQRENDMRLPPRWRPTARRD